MIFMWYSCDIHVAPAGEVFHLDPWNWRWLRSDGCADDGVFCESFGLCHGQMVVKVTKRIAWKSTFQHDAKKLPRPKHGLRELCLEKLNRLGNESGPKLHTLRAHHQECMFHMRIRPQKRALVAAPFWALAELWAKCNLHYRTDYFWEGMWLENRQGVQSPVWTIAPQTRALPSVIRPLVRPDYAPQTLHVNKGLRPSHLWLRPSYVPITPLKPACK